LPLKAEARPTFCWCGCGPNNEDRFASEGSDGAPRAPLADRPDTAGAGTWSNPLRAATQPAQPDASAAAAAPSSGILIRRGGAQHCGWNTPIGSITDRDGDSGPNSPPLRGRTVPWHLSTSTGGRKICSICWSHRRRGRALGACARSLSSRRADPG
jgi:hypothetical protein